jgi:hypothetical protein
MGTDRPVAGIANPCRWCGTSHAGEHCPLVKAFEFDPASGIIIRVEFTTAADWSADAQQPDYPRLKPRTPDA